MGKSKVLRCTANCLSPLVYMEATGTAIHFYPQPFSRAINFSASVLKGERPTPGHKFIFQPHMLLDSAVIIGDKANKRFQFDR